MKLEIQTVGAVTFGVVFVCVTVLVALGKAPAEMLGGLLALAAPSPFLRTAPRPAPLSAASSSDEVH